MRDCELRPFAGEIIECLQSPISKLFDTTRAPGLSSRSNRCYADSTDEVDEIMNRAEKVGGSITDPAHDRGGGYSGYFQDLDGHL
jgi:predicted enzyme related to lactoylglutathione lyase